MGNCLNGKLGLLPVITNRDTPFYGVGWGFGFSTVVLNEIVRT